MIRLIVSILTGAVLGATLGLWTVRLESRPPAPPATPHASPVSRSAAGVASNDPSRQTTLQLLSQLQRLVPEAQLRLRAWRDGRITPEMANALDLSADEVARVNSTVSELADEMARAAHERIKVETTSDGLSLIVPALAPAGDAKQRLRTKFREAIGEERTQLLLSAAGSREQLDRECRFFGEYELTMELRTTSDSTGSVLLTETALRYGDVVDERGRSLGGRYVMHRVPLLKRVAARPAELERFAGARWRQLVPEQFAAQLK